MDERWQPVAAGAGLGTDVALSQLQAQNQLLLTLFRISAALASELGTQDLPSKTVQLIVDMLPDVANASLWLFNRVERRLRLIAAYSIPGAPSIPPEVANTFALRFHEGYIGHVAATRQPLVLTDVNAYARELQALDPMRTGLLDEVVANAPWSLRSMCLPLYLGAIPIGVLELITLEAEARPSPDELPLLQAFADQLAVVIRNAQIYAEMSAQHRRLQAFDAVVTAITNASDIAQMLEQALSVTLYVVGADRGMIVLFDGSNGYVEVSYQMPEPFEQPGFAFELDMSPFAEVARAGQPSVQPVPDEHPWNSITAAGSETMALLPLLAGGTVVGTLAIGQPVEHDVRLDWPSLLALGNQIGIAVANYQLFSASQRERRQLAGVIAAIAEGVLICDRNGTLVLSNQAAASVLGRSLEPGTPLDELAEQLAMRTLEGRLLAVGETPLARSLNGDVYRDFEVSVTSGLGTNLVINCSGAPLFSDDGTVDGAVVVFRDISAYKQHDALRDEFVAVAAHEMRAPLAAIKGYTDLLVQREIQRPDATERDRKGIALLSRQIDHLVRLVGNLLDVSRLDAGRLELYLQTVDLIGLIEASIDRISVGDANHHFSLNSPPTLEIVCDQLRLQQVFTNLLSNAARYSTPGTHITVEVWTETCTVEDGVIVASGGPESCVVMAVRDEGVGMPPEVQAKVFDRYYRANTATAASGLGLGVYISREIVVRHGGRIWLESTPGVGTTFYVMLPQNGPRS